MLGLQLIHVNKRGPYGLATELLQYCVKPSTSIYSKLDHEQAVANVWAVIIFGDDES